VVSIPEAAPVEEAPPQPRVIFDPEQDDFFVLPGESLAKYTRPGEEEAGEGTESEPLREERGRALEEFESEGAPASLAEAVVEAEAARGVPETVAALEPVVVPEAVAAPEPVEATPVATPVAEEPPAAEPMPIQVFSLETGFSAVETEVPERAETADVEAVADEPVEIDEEVEIEGEAEGVESSMGGEATEEGAGEPAAEDEGPEPARIPTSLTATLREQGGRYPHRVSRRTRRKGRGGDRGPAGRAARPAG
jgi:ribonuclease G